MKFDREKARKIVKIAFPDYNGRKIYQVECNAIDATDGAHWFEGSKTDYVFVRADGATMSNPIDNLAPWTNVNGIITLPQHVVCVARKIFRGRVVSCTIYSAPENYINGGI